MNPALFSCPSPVSDLLLSRSSGAGCSVVGKSLWCKTAFPDEVTLQVKGSHQGSSRRSMSRSAQSWADSGNHQQQQRAAAQFELVRVEPLSEAFEHLSRERFDVVLLDLSLADGQGIEAGLEVRAGTPDVPIAGLGGLGEEGSAAKAVRVGAQDYLVKGQADRNLLVGSVRYAIERHWWAELERDVTEGKRAEAAARTLAHVGRGLIQLLDPRRGRATHRRCQSWAIRQPGIPPLSAGAEVWRASWRWQPPGPPTPTSRPPEPDRRVGRDAHARSSPGWDKAQGPRRDRVTGPGKGA